MGLAAIGLGLSILLVYAWVEVVNTPGTSLVDGYWIGRVPWTPAGVVLVLAGSLAAVGTAAAIVMVRGDWVRRILVLPVAAVPVLWWATALGVVPFPRFQAPDPVTFAYSLPVTAALGLILPSLAAAALALVPIRPDSRFTMSPVRPDGPVPPDAGTSRP
jgi:hypothetical protein